MEIQSDKVKKLLEMLNGSSDWVKDLAANCIESALKVDKKETEVKSETTPQKEETKKDDKQETSSCSENKCACCEHCAECHADENIELTDDFMDDSEVEDDDNFDDVLFNKMINEVVSKHRAIVTKLVKSYNGILDKSKALEILSETFAKDSVFKDYGITKVDGESITPRFEAICAVQACEDYNILEWRNLLMTHRGYGRLVRMFAEFSSQAQAANLGVKLDIGCQFPPQWNQENKK